MSKIIHCIGLSGLICLAAPGCIIASGDTTGPKMPTVGQELRDLKVAHDEGALEQPEYDDARQKLLARLDKPRG
ncbi:MAG TPA: hypothetical protein VFB66_16915 [Tepidisphaeraceae bacterium]|nr:hypothetical protein [Tepidisphaeraceae bacterium]